MSTLLSYLPYIVALVLYIAISIAKRPHPEKLKGWKRKVWLVADAIAFLTPEDLPGKFKLPFTASKPEDKA